MPNLFFIVTITFILYLIFGSPELSLLNDTISSLGGFSNLYYLFTNKDYSNSPYWDFNVTNTIECIIEAQLNPDNLASGCAVLLVGFKQ